MVIILAAKHHVALCVARAHTRKRSSENAISGSVSIVAQRAMAGAQASKALRNIKHQHSMA